MIANTDKNCVDVKLAYTLGNVARAGKTQLLILAVLLHRGGARLEANELLLDRNSNVGIATCLVAEIFDRFKSTFGMMQVIASRISSRQIIRAVTHFGADFAIKPAFIIERT